MLFKDWAKQWLETYKKPFVTENTYVFSYYNLLRLHLIPFFGDMDMKDIKPLTVQQFFAENTHISESTLDKFHMILAALFRTAIDNDYCIKNPINSVVYRSVYHKKRKRVYTLAEIRKIENYAIGRFPAVVILLETGLRRGELLGLRWCDIDFNRRTLSVNHSICDNQGGGVTLRPPKWNSYRTLPLSPKAYFILSMLPQTSEYVFPTKFQKAQSPHTFSKKLVHFMQSAAVECGCAALSAHELRHTYGTNLRRRNVDIYTIQRVMGHKDINMTARIYVHNEIEVLRSALGYEKVEGNFSSNI